MEEFLSKWQNLIAGVLIALVLAYGVYNYVYKPKMKEINNLNNSLKLIDSEIKMFEGGYLLLKDLNAAKAMLNKELDDIAKKIPSESETPYLINNFVSIVGKGLNIDYNLIEPAGLVQEQKYKRMPLKVEFSGDYADLNNYLAQLKKLPVTIRVDSLELRKMSGSKKLSVSMMLSAFVMPGGAIQKPMAEMQGYSYMYDPFYAERAKQKAKARIETVTGLRYSGYFMGKEIRAIINDEVLKVGESISGYKVLKINKDRTVLEKGKKQYELTIKGK